MSQENTLSIIPITLKKENQSLHQHLCMFLEPTILKSQPQNLLLLFLSCCNIWPVCMWRFMMELYSRQSLQEKSVNLSLWVNQKNRQKQIARRKETLHNFISNCLYKITKLNPELTHTAWKNHILQGRSFPLIWLSKSKAFKGWFEQWCFPPQNPTSPSIFLCTPTSKFSAPFRNLQPVVSSSFFKLHCSSPSLLAPPPPQKLHWASWLSCFQKTNHLSLNSTALRAIWKENLSSAAKPRFFFFF